MPSLLQAQYGHIVPQLTQSWGSAERFERFIGTLFFDDRWDRKGWPAEAWAELQFLHARHRLAYAQQYPKRDDSEDDLKWL